MRSQAEKQSSSKPVPPNDLWSKLDEALQEVGARPEGSFTRSEFAAQKGVTMSQAGHQIGKLLRAGKITKHGNGTSTFYQLVKL